MDRGEQHEVGEQEGEIGERGFLFGFETRHHEGENARKQPDQHRNDAGRLGHDKSVVVPRKGKGHRGESFFFPKDEKVEDVLDFGDEGRPSDVVKQMHPFVAPGEGGHVMEQQRDVGEASWDKKEREKGKRHGVKSRANQWEKPAFPEENHSQKHGIGLNGNRQGQAKISDFPRPRAMVVVKAEKEDHPDESNENRVPAGKGIDDAAMEQRTYEKIEKIPAF